jgi:hypothetical protein
MEEKYINKWEKKLKSKIFTQQGVLNFFNEFKWSEEIKTQSQWKTDIDAPLFIFKTKRTGSKLSAKDSLHWNRVLVPLSDKNTTKKNIELKNYWMHLNHDPNARVAWDKDIASSKTIITEDKFLVNYVVNESPFKALISNRDHVEKKFFFRDRNDNDALYTYLSAVPDAIMPKCS